MKSKFAVRLLVLLLAACLAATTVAAAAPAVSKPSPQSVGTKPVEIKVFPGIITITAPASGAAWYTGSSQNIAWSGEGPRPAANGPVNPLGPVDVTLWRGGQLAATITAATSAASVTYTVPLTMAAGSYELRVTSKNFANLETRRPLTIMPSTVTLGPTPTTLVAGTAYAVTWTRTGSPGPLDLALVSAANGYTERLYYIARGLTGNSHTWSLPAAWANDRYKLQLQLTDAGTGAVYSTSTIFTVMGITFRTPQANEQIAPGYPYSITWNYTADPDAPFSLYLVGQGQEYLLYPSLRPFDSKGVLWPANQPPTGTSFQMAAYAVGTRIVVGRSQSFTFKSQTFTVGKPYTSTATSDGIVAGHDYTIPYNSELPPASYKIEIIGAADGQVAETVSASAVIAQTANGKYSSWTPLTTHPAAFYGKGYKVRMTGLAAGGRVAESPSFTIYKTAGTTTGTVTTSTGTSGGGGTTGTTGASGSSGGSGTVRLTQDTSYHYNAQDSATFRQGAVLTLDGNGYVTQGQLASDQSLNYRSGKSVRIRGISIPSFNGYLASGQLVSDESLEYASGKMVYLRGGSVVSFAGGYVSQGQLDFNQSLEYGSGKKTTFLSASKITFAGGCVSKGQLAYDTSLEYASNKRATFDTVGLTTFRTGGYVKSGTLSSETYLTDTNGQNQKVPALSVVTFDDSGRMVSYTASNFNLNP